MCEAADRQSGQTGREALSGEKQAQILRGAADIFARDGYEGASMSCIAARAAVSKGTLYNYFASKDDLFTAYVQAECRSKLAHVFHDLDHAPDVATALTDMGQRMQYLMFSPAGMTMHRMVVSEGAKFPELARAFYEAGPTMAIRAMADWLAQQTKAGKLAVPDPVFAAEQFYALCRTRFGLLRELHLINDPPMAEIEDVVVQAVRMFLKFYAPER